MTCTSDLDPFPISNRDSSGRDAMNARGRNIYIVADAGQSTRFMSGHDLEFSICLWK